MRADRELILKELQGGPKTAKDLIAAFGAAGLYVNEKNFFDRLERMIARGLLGKVRVPGRKCNLYFIAGAARQASGC